MYTAREMKEKFRAGRVTFCNSARRFGTKWNVKVYILIVAQDKQRWYSYETTDALGSLPPEAARKNGRLPVPSVKKDLFSPLLPPNLSSHSHDAARSDPARKLDVDTRAVEDTGIAETLVPAGAATAKLLEEMMWFRDVAGVRLAPSC